jgi:TonB family protein
MQTLTSTPLFRPPASGRWARRRPQPGLALAVLCVHGWVMALALQSPSPRLMAAAAEGAKGVAQAEGASPSGERISYLRLLPDDGTPKVALPSVSAKPLALAAVMPAAKAAQPGQAAVKTVSTAVSIPPAAVGATPIATPEAGLTAASASAVASRAGADRSSSVGSALAHAASAPPAAQPGQPGDALPLRAPVAVASNTLPSYPEAAREDHLQGAVAMVLQVDEQGRVRSVQWLRRSGVAVLDVAARDAVRAWRYQPALRGAEPVSASVTVTLHFRLDGPVQQTTLAEVAR